MLFIKYLPKNDEKGQTLIIIVMIMILALSVGITISERFISTLRNIISSDDSAKAMGIAEAGIERILILPYETISDYVIYGNCGSDCLLTQTDVTGQQIQASVTLSFTGNTSDPYSVDLVQDDVNELTLQGYPTNQSIEVCWNGTASIYASYVYDTSGTIRSKGYAYNSSTYSGTTNDFLSPYSANGYQNCFAVIASSSPLLLRLKSIYENTSAVVIPAAGHALPSQGISIVSIGTAGDAKRTVSVVKSNSKLPALFDYVLYQKSTSIPLSN